MRANNILLYKNLSEKGVNFYNPISKLRKIAGISLVIVAILPNGLFIPSMMLSCLCLGIKLDYVKCKLFNTSLLIKSKLGVLK